MGEKPTFREWITTRIDALEKGEGMPLTHEELVQIRALVCNQHIIDGRLREALHVLTGVPTAVLPELLAELEHLLIQRDENGAVTIQGSAVCLFCGERFEGIEQERCAALREHVTTCAMHPLAALRAENEKLRERIRALEAKEDGA